MAQPVRRYCFGPFCLDTAAGRLERDGAALDLEPKSFQVLLFLVENQGRLVTKEELLAAAWKDTFVTDNALTRVVAQLRKTLGDDARDAVYIETAPRMGYRFAAAVDVETPAVAAAPLRWPAAAAIGGVAVLAALLAWSVRGERAPALVSPHQWTTADALDFGPSFSPDASAIVYSSDRWGKFQIYVQSLAAGSREAALTADDGENIQPDWSPDGQWIAYASMRRGGIHVIPSSGGMPRQVSPFGVMPKWAPDSRRLVFRSGRMPSLATLELMPNQPATLWVTDRDEALPRALTRTGEPAGAHNFPVWLGDGKQVLFVAHNDAASRFFCADSGTGKARPLEGDVAVGATPTVLSGGEYLFVASMHRTYGWAILRQRLDAEGCRVRGPSEVAWSTGQAMPRDLAFSRDGRKMAAALTTANSQLWTLPLNKDTGERAGAPRVLRRNESMRNSRPAFSPDGSTIAFVLARFGERGDIWTMNDTGWDLRQITSDPLPEYMPIWMPSGERIAYTRKLTVPSELWSVAKDGSGPRSMGVVPDFSGPPTLSPDGAEVAYHDSSMDRRGVWRTRPGSGAARRLTPEGVVAGYPMWPPAGDEIAVEVMRDGNTFLGFVPATGGALRTIVDVPGQTWPGSFSADGQWLAAAIQRGGGWALARIHRQTGETRMWLEESPVRTFLRYPAWSPRGDQVVYEQYETRGNLYLADVTPVK